LGDRGFWIGRLRGTGLAGLCLEFLDEGAEFLPECPGSLLDCLDFRGGGLGLLSGSLGGGAGFGAGLPFGGFGLVGDFGFLPGLLGGGLGFLFGSLVDQSGLEFGCLGLLSLGAGFLAGLAFGLFGLLGGGAGLPAGLAAGGFFLCFAGAADFAEFAGFPDGFDELGVVLFVDA
jgi:hypothetical protein